MCSLGVNGKGELRGMRSVCGGDCVNKPVYVVCALTQSKCWYVIQLELCISQSLALPSSFLAAGPPPFLIWWHLFRDVGREKRREEQLKWSLAFRLYIGSFPCAQLPGPVHTARLGRECVFLCI